MAHSFPFSLRKAEKHHVLASAQLVRACTAFCSRRSSWLNKCVVNPSYVSLLLSEKVLWLLQAQQNDKTSSLDFERGRLSLLREESKSRKGCSVSDCVLVRLTRAVYRMYEVSSPFSTKFRSC